MKINFLKVTKSRLLGTLVCFLMASLLITTPVFAQSLITTQTVPDALPPVEVPVVLDGVLYQADEFNAIHKELHDKGVYLTSVVNPSDGVFYAFTSQEGYEEFALKYGLPSIAKMVETTKKIQSEAGNSSNLVLTDFYMYNFEDIEYGGQYKATHDGVDYLNLHTEGWGDRISSMFAFPNTAEWGFENINYGGDSNIFIGSQYEIHSFGWGDRISSCIVGYY